MSKAFDAYESWLGIPPQEQPADHYRLLGIDRFEADATVIQSAAEKRMAFLQAYKTGKYGAVYERLAGEIAAARACLLNAAAKPAYDAEIRSQLVAKLVGGSVDIDFASLPGAASRSPAQRKPRAAARRGLSRRVCLLAGGGAALGGVLLIVTVYALSGSNNPSAEVAQTPAPAAPRPQQPHLSRNSASKPSRSKPDSDAHAPTAPESDVAESDSPVRPHLPAGEKPEGTASPAANRAAEGGAAPANPPAAAEKTPPAEQPSAPAKLAPPSAEEQRRLIADIDEIYKPDKPTSALARRLLEDGRADEAHRAEQFVLFRRAGEIARDAGDADLMMEAVDALVAAGFDIRPLPLKARLLQSLAVQSASCGSLQVLVVSSACLKLAEEAVAGDAFSEAEEVLDAARKLLARPLVQAQSSLRTAKAALARARQSADKPELKKKVEEAQADVESIKSAQAAVADCAKGLPQARRDYEAVRTAQDRLKAAPDDPEACLAVGRWMCFQQGDWDEGLKLLAKGSDEDLKTLAAKELAGEPATVDERLSRGDAWWAQAENTEGKSKAALRRRAGHWYHQALPEMPLGLARSKVEKRLAQLPKEETGKDGRKPAESEARPAAAPFDEKTARALQAAWARRLHVPVVQTNSIGMEFR